MIYFGVVYVFNLMIFEMEITRWDHEIRAVGSHDPTFSYTTSDGRWAWACSARLRVSRTTCRPRLVSYSGEQNARLAPSGEQKEQQTNQCAGEARSAALVSARRPAKPARIACPALIPEDI